MTKDKENENNYQCGICGKTFKHRQSKYKHPKNCGIEDRPLYPCNICSYVSNRKDTFIRHQRLCKGTQSQVICSICAKAFKY